MGCISGIVKIIMFIFNFACLLVGLALLILGSIFYASIDDFKNNLPGGVQAVPIVLIIVGVFIFLVSFLGCCGAIKSSKCMLLTYAIILIIILVIQLAVGIYGLVKVKGNYDEFKNETFIELYKVILKYNDDTASKVFIDSLQLTFKCCGINNKIEYTFLGMPYGQYPGSCCGKNNDYCDTDETKGTVACGNKFFSTLETYIEAISIVAIVICVVELLGALFAIYLSRQK